jgi:hypothetical protein
MGVEQFKPGGIVENAQAAEQQPDQIRQQAT